MAKEGMAFKKFPALHALEERHEVDLGFSYKNAPSAKTFTHYIAESQRQTFLASFFATSSFYSFLMDGSTDTGNVEDELVSIQFCVRDDNGHMIRSNTKYLSLCVPAKSDADGLSTCLSEALHVLGVDDVCDRESVLSLQGKPILVGGGTDGAAVNISQQNGMRGKLQRQLPWLQWTWCYSHHLELACKDAFSSQLFSSVDDMLLKLYYLYAKSPKKLRELADVVGLLKEVWEIPDGGYRPLRAQGSRWIAHKRNALQRVVHNYGAYLSHIVTLSEDPSTKSVDKSRLKGYINKWKLGKIHIGAAMYIDILKGPSLLSLSLQNDNLDVVSGLQHIIKTLKSLKVVADLDPKEWPTCKLICDRVKDDDGQKVYQGAVLSEYNPTALQACADTAVADARRLEDSVKARLEWSDLKLLRAILVFIDTQNWHASPSESEGEDDVGLSKVREAVELITSEFKEPLEAKQVDLAGIQDEVEEIVLYAQKFLNINVEGYQKVWYKLHTCPDASKWQNLIRVCELVFSLPFSNAHVERLFSTLKVIKTNRHTKLESTTLSDLLEIQVEGPPLDSFSANDAVSLWWKDCCTTRRTNQQPRKEYACRSRESGPTSTSTTEISEDNFTLDDWDEWFPNSTASAIDSDID